MTPEILFPGVYIEEIPSGVRSIAGVPTSVAAFVGRAPGLDGRNAALYFPWLRRPGTKRGLPPSGAVAGVFARTDAARGVLRIFPGAGPVVWGARTTSSDPEWKYVPVRRLCLFLERSIDEGTRWAVFEPNNEALWDRLRQSVEAFLHPLWREGAFQGPKPDDAFFVRCDRNTTTQTEIDRGLVNLEVGFAPLKPAEFTILRIVVRTGGRPRVAGRSHRSCRPSSSPGDARSPTP